MRIDILKAAEQYVAYCTENSLLPNRAGFCRYSGITISKYKKLCAKNREKAEMIEAVLEDEALNCGTKRTPAAVLNMYLKSRFGYGEQEDEELIVVSRHSSGDSD